MSIYLTCAGLSQFHGVYEATGYNFTNDTTIWINRNDSTKTIEYDAGLWYVKDNGTSYYSASNFVDNQVPILTKDMAVLNNLYWHQVNTASRPPLTYDYAASTIEVSSGNRIFDSFILSGAGISNINGTYNYFLDGTLGASYVNTNNLFRIVQWYSLWRIWPVGSSDTYYYFNGPGSEPPANSTGYTWVQDTNGNTSVPTSTINSTSMCNSWGDAWVSIQGSTGSTNFYIDNRDGINYLKMTNGIPKIRKS